MKTTCPYCGVGCGIEARYKDGDLVELSGDQSHPANKGRLCVKGSSVGETIGAEGRLLHPLYKGQRISWDQALQQVASEFTRTIDEHGPESVAFYLSGQLLTEDYYVANKLMKGFIGSANLDTNSRLCMASAVAGYKRAFGSDTVPCSYKDLECTDLLVIVGSNPAWAHPILFQRIKAAKNANPNMKVVVVDPRKTASCDIADLHLAIRPGSDTQLFNGLLCYLAKNFATDPDFIIRNTNGYSQALVAAKASSSDPAEVAINCDISESELLRFFRWYLETEKTVTLYSMGVNQSATGVDNSNTIINCHLATGRIGREGMGPFSITGQPNAMGGREVGGLANQLAAHMDFSATDIDRVRRFWNAPNMATAPGLKAIDMFEAVERGEIKAIWIMGTNPVVSMPNANQVKRALAACPLVVVSDCIAETDTSQFAHYQLPATGWSEKNGMVTNSERCISRQRGLLPSMGEARHDWQVLSEFAGYLGYEEAFNYQHQVDVFTEHARLSGFENGGSRDFDISLFSEMDRKQYDDFKPIKWPVNATSPTGTERMFTDGKFYTDDGRARFIAIRPQKPVQQTDDRYDFILNTGRIRDHWHTMTRTGMAAKLFQHRSEPFVEIHPDDARVKGIEENQLVKLSNQQGSYIGRARIVSAQRKGELFVPMHWTEQFTSQGRMGALPAPVADPISGQPELKHAAVAIETLAIVGQADLYVSDPLSQQILNDSAFGYWSRIPLKNSHRYTVAIADSEFCWSDWLVKHLGKPTFIMQDNTQGQLRAGAIKDGNLQWILLVVPQQRQQDDSWLDVQFDPETQLSDPLSLLRGISDNQQAKGKIICSCYQVGELQIKYQLEQGATTASELASTLKCGSNCGSCIPEINDLVSRLQSKAVV